MSKHYQCFVETSFAQIQGSFDIWFQNRQGHGDMRFRYVCVWSNAVVGRNADVVIYVPYLQVHIIYACVHVYV